jgi:ribonuclease P protein subunit RPR2
MHIYEIMLIMPMARPKDKAQFKKIALERIHTLFEQARKQFSTEPALSKRYVELARKLQMRYKVKMPQEYKYRFCKSCGVYWMPSKTVRVRTKDGKVVHTCLKCKRIRRIHYD